MPFRTIFFALAIFAAIAIAPVAYAATVHVGDTVSLSAGETVADDAYISGNTVSVAGSIEEDLGAIGSSVLINGAVGVDALLFGGTVDVLAPVGDDLRTVGGTVRIGESVGGDVVAGGASVHILSGSTVSGDAIILAQRIRIDGAIDGDLTLIGGEVIVNGTVGGSVDIRSAERVVLEDGARIAGDVAYRAPQELARADGAEVAGNIAFTQTDTIDSGEIAAFFAFLGGAFFVAKFLMLLAAALAAVLFFRAQTMRLAERAVARPARTIGLGFVGLIVIPIAALVLLATIIGALFGIALLLVYGLILLAAHVGAGIVLGAVLAKWFRKELIVDWKWTTLGVIVFHSVALVPFVGWFVTLLFVLAVFGAVLDWGNGCFQRLRE